MPIKKNVPVATNSALARNARAVKARPATRTREFTAAELGEFQRLIEEQLTNLRREYADAIATLDVQHANALDNAGDDTADTGNKTFEREQALSIAQNRMDIITQLERAQSRIKAGTYGHCESCGKAIPKGRLQAYPAATLCVDCKAKEERR